MINNTRFYIAYYIGEGVNYINWKEKNLPSSVKRGLSILNTN